MSFPVRPPDSVAFEPARVLLVEDDVFDRDYIRHALRGDFELVEVGDGDAGLAAMARQEFDVVLADNGLPGISGEHFLRLCQERRPDTSRVLLSGALNLEIVLRLVNEGHVYACLQKPVDPNALLTTVHNAARVARLIRERSLLIRELADANAQVFEEQQQLLALNNELKILVTIATHDLREPIRSTRFFLDKVMAAREVVQNAELVGHLERVRRAHDRMDQLLSGLREWLSVQAGEFRLEPADVGMIVTEVKDNLARAIHEREVSLRLPDTWPSALANAPLLRSVFENLIANAIRFSPDNAPDVTLRWSRPGPGMLRFEVADHGIGIDPAYHEQVFGMFRRLESRRKFEGTGAGLAIVQKIVQRHGGEIGVESERGHGATFWFTLQEATAA